MSEFNEDFAKGFHWASLVFDAMGSQITFDETMAFLELLAAGEVSLQPTPEEIIKNVETQYKKPLPESLRKMVHRVSRGEDRRKSDESAQRIAKDFLAFLNGPMSK